ncbi:MAG: DUF2169 domain-containing protein, partial [Myxococcota bacterium]
MAHDDDHDDDDDDDNDTVLPPALPPRTSDVVPWFSEATLRGASFPWRPDARRWVHTVVAKATLDLDPSHGALELRTESLPPSGDEHDGDPPLGGLRRPFDLSPAKSRTDVTLWGHAHADEVRFAFGPRPHGGFDRRLRIQRSPQAPRDPVPLRYELGRHDAQHNPVGRGPGDDDGHPLIVARDGGPDGVGPIPMMWPQRLAAFGTYDERWYASRHPHFAEDLHPDAFQSAPRCQQLESVRGAERFQLEGLHPRFSVIKGQLPGLWPRIYAVHAAAGGSRFVALEPRLDGVFFDLDELVVTLTWRAVVDVSDARGTGIEAWYGVLAAAGTGSAPVGLR